jgi:hypothetical protein
MKRTLLGLGPSFGCRYRLGKCGSTDITQQGIHQWSFRPCHGLETQTMPKGIHHHHHLLWQAGKQLYNTGLCNITNHQSRHRQCNALDRPLCASTDSVCRRHQAHAVSTDFPLSRGSSLCTRRLLCRGRDPMWRYTQKDHLRSYPRRGNPFLNDRPSLETLNYWTVEDL